MALSEKLIESPALQAFKMIAKEEPCLLIEELWNSPKAALIHLLSQSLHKNILIISSSTDDQLYADLQTLCPIPILEFPSWETLPGEEITPSPDIIGKRFETLFSIITSQQPHIILTSLQASLQKLPSTSLLKSQCRFWKLNDQISFGSVPSQLEALGYRRSTLVSDKGEYAIRGGIIDLFPIASFDPYRVEFFGDTIEQIRIFDPVSQKSIQKVDCLFLSPASEGALCANDLKNQEFDKKAPQNSYPCTLLDYVGDQTLVIMNDLLKLEDRYVSLKSMLGASSPYFLTLEQFFQRCDQLPLHLWTEQRMEALSTITPVKKAGRQFYSGKEPLQPLSFHIFDMPLSSKRWEHPFHQVSDFFALDHHRASNGSEILQGIHQHAKSTLNLHFIGHTEAEIHALKEQIASEHIQLPQQTFFHLGYLSSGFVLNDIQLAYVPTTELTHRYQPRRQKWRNTYHTPASEFHELSPGDIVVHFHSGIAKYIGIDKHPNHAGQLTEFIVLEYADNSKLFVPIAQSHLVSRYIGVKEEVPTLSLLGSPRWQKTRIQAQQAIIGYADQLLRLTAARELHGGFAFDPDSKQMQSFEADFPFVETEDQLLAIDAIKKDMISSKAMDRLICGDVGYGKTEVAMRAAFKAVADGHKQVAILVPTTVLAMQHYETLCDRMANFPIQIGVISRFCSTKQIKETLKKTAAGQINILVGTHRIISKDVHFKDLGLIIVDEEQRFGVRAKEHLKNLKTGVDCITLSATPIPRTLYLSLIGAKEISVINTPPQDRLPIKSIIAEKELSLIQIALHRELSRDGQAFFIHNRVESIFRVRDELQKMLPQARIVVGHGQMSADELDTIFHSFKNGESDILVATTIIENGIDIPNANTILIDRADTFGIADLYQMRGRVGRWNRPAYAYFLVPHRKELSEIASKRLHALAQSSGYGGGMKVAMRDLELRGAGDILGTQQSGQISTVGFHLYCKLLKKAIDALKNKSSPSFIETKMEFTYPASLSEDYINESSLRMEIYHRLGEASTLKEIDAILTEMQDRFGPCPTSVLWLYHLTRLRLFASQHQLTFLKFEKITFTAERQKGTTLDKKIFPLPRIQNPAELEVHVMNQLKAWVSPSQYFCGKRP